MSSVSWSRCGGDRRIVCDVLNGFREQLQECGDGGAVAAYGACDGDYVAVEVFDQTDAVDVGGPQLQHRGGDGGDSESGFDEGDGDGSVGNFMPDAGFDAVATADQTYDVAEGAGRWRQDPVEICGLPEVYGGAVEI